MRRLRGHRLDPDPLRRLGDDPEEQLTECPRCRGNGGSDGKGMVRRQCTSEYKLKPIKKTYTSCSAPRAPRRATATSRPRQQTMPGEVFAINWVGIYTDEIGRQRPSDVQYLKRVDPLIDMLDVSHADCIAYLTDRWPFPVPRLRVHRLPAHSRPRVARHPRAPARRVAERHRVGPRHPQGQRQPRSRPRHRAAR